MTDSFLSRLDLSELEKLCEDNLPVDALNLVRFSGIKSYRWYGLFLSPLVLFKGGRPLFVAKHEKCLAGEKTFDEIVIIRYPNMRVFTRILTGRYYSVLNRLREKGVRYFEFSFNRSFRESSRLREKGLRLVVRFDFENVSFGNILDRITNLLGYYPVIQLYAALRTSVIPFKGEAGPSDPNPGRYEGIVVFSIIGDDAAEFSLEKETISSLEASTKGLSVDVFRSPGLWESMPWSG